MTEYQTINVNELKVYWINDNQNINRYQHMNNILKLYFPNNERINAIFDKPKYNGITMAHLIALLKGLRTQKPFIILEDDVDIKTVPEILKIPANADALYLGISCWGNKKHEKDFSNTKIITEDSNIYFKKGALGIIGKDSSYFKILSMYGAHAILYISEKYIRKSIMTCVMALMKNRPHDIYLPRMQSKYEVYGTYKPVFFQNIKLGGQERYTNITINII